MPRLLSNRIVSEPSILLGESIWNEVTLNHKLHIDSRDNYSDAKPLQVPAGKAYSSEVASSDILWRSNENDNHRFIEQATRLQRLCETLSWLLRYRGYLCYLLYSTVTASVSGPTPSFVGIRAIC